VDKQGATHNLLLFFPLSPNPASHFKMPTLSDKAMSYWNKNQQKTAISSLLEDKENRRQ
jgi:hypothetical protein